MASPRPPELMDELVEEVLLRVPPDDPVLLLRAALACKSWCRLVAGRGFRRRYRQLHRTPPVLGFVYNSNGINFPSTVRFVPTSSFRPPRANLGNWAVIHSGHGRVLLVKAPVRNGTKKILFLVWDPITDNRRELPPFSWRPFTDTASWNAVVVCASSANSRCSHLDCHGGPFFVLFVGRLGDKVGAYVYSSEANAWSLPIYYKQESYDQHFHLATSVQVLVGNAFYFKYHTSAKLLKYDLITHEMSVIHLPAESSLRRVVLMAMDDGRLGCASVFGSKLYLWSREVGFYIEARWSIIRVIELEPLLPTGAFSASLDVIGSAVGAGIILMATVAGLFTFDLMSRCVKKLGDGYGHVDIVPFMTFCTPVLGAANTDEGPGGDA